MGKSFHAVRMVFQNRNDFALQCGDRRWFILAAGTQREFQAFLEIDISFHRAIAHQLGLNLGVLINIDRLDVLSQLRLG
ncbi:hypothetical protein D3C83_74640 [compost metagenome]